jgi:hypothetical protein
LFWHMLFLREFCLDSSSDVGGAVAENFAAEV